MRWQKGRRSSNIEDRRGMRLPSKMVGGGIGTIILILTALYFGFDPSVFLQEGTGSTLTTDRPSTGGTPEENELAEFVSVVLADTEDTWHDLFRRAGAQYREPKLVLFSGTVQSACGFAQSATGPFYCPADEKVYLDLSFFEELRRRFAAPGDFAQAYVIAHEVGHHVQTLTGISKKVLEARRQSGKRQANTLLVRQELQADCFAGLWAHHADRTRQIIEEGDIEEALNAANAIGDDRLQMQSKGRVVPDSFTHGSSAQRIGWFKRGLATGSLDACNTFDSD
ncbi:MAG: flagellar biosynthesis anti-sigma factor FlgM [Desulfatitalea sp. BRH_c12]|nr:MAG: flagellar biosynthesis anti-sigma factor FlgM [Desulfatitalea sp. BRH_c12]